MRSSQATKAPLGSRAKTLSNRSARRSPPAKPDAFRQSRADVSLVREAWCPSKYWNWKNPTVLIPGILSKIRPRNCPNQSYVRCITDIGPAPGVGG